MSKDLVTLADRLDSLGFTREANLVDALLNKKASDEMGAQMSENLITLKSLISGIAGMIDAARAFSNTNPLFEGNSGKELLASLHRVAGKAGVTPDEAMNMLSEELDSFKSRPEMETSGEPPIDYGVLKKANVDFQPSEGSTSKGSENGTEVNKDPAKILGVNTVQDVQSKITSIQNSLKNPDDLILGRNKDETAIKAYRSLMLVLAQAIVETDIATQLSDVREAAADWISWATLGNTNMSQDNRIVYNFLTAAAARLSAGKPVFDFKTSTLNVFENTELKSQDAKWASYISKDNRRAAIRDAWSKLSKGNDLSFDNYVLWWKSNKENKKFNDGNAGGIAATIARLKEETNPS